MKIVELLLLLIFPPVCVSCRKTMPIHHKDFLCEECRERWDEEKKEFCRRCGQPIYNCWCGVPGDSGFNIDSEGHLTQYQPNEETVTKNILYFFKNFKDKQSFEYIAKEMADELCRPTENTVITSVPRAKSKVRIIGHDQALEIAKRIADECNIEYIDVIVHSGNEVQKNLSIKDRKINAKKSYKLKTGVSPLIKGRDVILIDDVCTTGATATRCAELLKRRGAKSVRLVCISKTV